MSNNRFIHIKMKLVNKLIFKLFFIKLTVMIIYGWFFYLPFIGGRIAGVYQLAAYYSYGSAFVLLFLILLLPIIIIITLPRSTTVFRLTLLIVLALIPAMGTLDFGRSLTIESWQKTYVTAYRSDIIENRYGQGLIFQCESRKMICRVIHSFTSDIGTIAHLWLKYDRDSDRFTVEYSRVENSKMLIYARSKHKKLIEAEPPLF